MFGPVTDKKELEAWRKGVKRMESTAVEIDGKMYEKIVVDANTIIYHPITEEQIPTRKKKREPNASAEREPGSS